MEKRLILAIVLSLIVLVGYNLLFVKPKPQVEPAPTETAAAPTAGAQALPTGQVPPSVAGAKPAAQPPAAPELKETVAGAETGISVETSLYSAAWSNRGGVLKSWKLKRYLNDLKKKGLLDLVPAAAQETGLFPFSLGGDDRALAGELNAALFEAPKAGLSLRDGETGELRFAYSDGKTVRAEKIFRFTGGTYQVGIEIRVWKNGQEVVPALLWGPGIGSSTPAELKGKFTAAMGAAIYTGGKVSRMDVKKYKAETSAFNFVDWAAFEDNYFATLFVLPAQKGQAVLLQDPRGQGQAPVYYLSVSQPQEAFIGPKESAALVAFGHDAKKVIRFGSFLGINLQPIAEIMLAAVRYLHGLVPNWGAAIILLTLVIKIIFFPLTYSSTKSMAKMADLQPKVKALRAKYKKAKTDIAQRREMNEEMMKLYKAHGINPAGGCLPLLIQMPVFVGAYQMLTAAVEFRHASFALWIKDLSVMDPTYVTPILMGATQFISQKMTPTSADPTQAKMMLIMPVFMTYIFASFPSGLVLYWLTTNVLQIAQQAIMNKMMARQKRESDEKRRA